jgi:class 3 adenylate cyclase
MAPILFHGLSQLGLPVVCVESRQGYQALKYDPDVLFTLRKGKSRGPQVLRVLRRGARASLRLRLCKPRKGPVRRGLRASARREAEVAANPPVETDGDRRPVAIMFCDLVGYTRLSSKLDPEEVRALLEQLFGVIDATVERYGGMIDKHIGDATMALFGAPKAHGDNGLRAVRAALDIQAAVPPQLSTVSGPLAVHVGLAMGEVVASRVGSERRRDYAVIGEAANLAARLRDQPRAGETLVSQEIWRATSRFAEFEILGGQDLKGHERPVPVFRLKGLREAAVGAWTSLRNPEGR